jgi:putative cardiolipin synthase
MKLRLWEIHAAGSPTGEIPAMPPDDGRFEVLAATLRIAEERAHLVQLDAVREQPLAVMQRSSITGNSFRRCGSRRSRTSQFALHAKLFVLDRERLFLGSMNFDARSLRLNTEIGLLIDSPELVQEVSSRFDAIAQPANSYVPTLGPPDASGKRQLAWRTEENGKMVELTAEPSRDPLRGVQTGLLSLLPIDDLL